MHRFAAPMKTYLQLLAYAGPVRRFLFFYLLNTLLAILLGLINLSLLIPLLEVLFSRADIDLHTLGTTTTPHFSISLEYLKGLFTHYFMDIIATHGRIGALYFVCMIMVIAVLLANLFKYLAAMMMAELRINVIHNLRQVLLYKVSQLYIEYTYRHKGDIMAKIMSDVQEVENGMHYIFKAFFKDPATITGLLMVLFYISPQLTWLTLSALPILGGGITLLLRKLLQRATQNRASLGRLNSILEEFMEGMRAIKSFEAHPYMLHRFALENKSYARLNLSMLLYNNLVPLLSEFLGVLVMTMLLAYGGKMVFLNTSTFTASTFMTYIIIFSQVLVKAKSISRSLSNIQHGLAAGNRILFLINTPSTMLCRAGTHGIATLRQAIIFKEVAFAYDRKFTVRQLNLKIEAGKKVALLGRSGSGKSTIINLLSRLCDVTHGVIQIDGIPLQAYNIVSLRQLIGIATPTTTLFHDTVFNNIALGRAKVSASAVTIAAEVAQVHTFIEALPQGYQTILGTKGYRLSNSQAQQIGIARAVLTKPAILILDDATSTLDKALATKIQAAVTTHMHDKTLIIGAHRLYATQQFDEIFVIDAGAVVAHGTHAALMQKSPLYQQLHRLPE